MSRRVEDEGNGGHVEGKLIEALLFMRNLDDQMFEWADKLVGQLKIADEESGRLATTIASQVRWLPSEVKQEIRDATPVDTKSRYEELIAFQKWMDIAHSTERHPEIVRAQVIVQNYICFVYLHDSCFKVLRSHLPSGSCAKKCCNFLINNPVRAFRNAIAHSNWCYKDDFSGLRFWARKGNKQEEPLIEWEVSQDELAFWQALSRCVAYVTYENL